MKYGIILVSKELEYIYYPGRVVFAEAYQPRRPIQRTGQGNDRGLQNCDDAVTTMLPAGAHVGRVHSEGQILLISQLL